MRAVVCTAAAALLLCLLSVVSARSHRGTQQVPHSGARGSDATAGLGAAAGRRLNTNPFFNVVDFGAKGDNATDNTGAFTAAFTAASTAGGGTVLVPAGLYVFQGTLNLPPAVNLKGTYETVPSHPMVGGAPPPADGSILLPFYGQGNASATPFITINTDSTLAGFVIWYPAQQYTNTPIPYPWTISMIANNAAITDVELLNSYNGISAVQAHRHYIARIQGQPTNIGIFVDSTYDIGRIEDVHFNPWYSDAQPYMSWQLLYGRAFVMGRSDWEYVFNTFAFGYSIGYHFVETPTGTMNGNFLGIGADLATNASVQVDASQPPGLLITNGEFTSFYTQSWCPSCNADSTQVVVSASNTGPVRFVDSSFWGPSDSVARLYGTGVVGFESCEFVQWDLLHKDGSPAIDVYAGSIILMGNDFQQPGNQVNLAAAVNKAVIVGNVIEGPLKINNAGMTLAPQIGYNAAG